jgi:cell division protein YceG involved in septum cleavage
MKTLWNKYSYAITLILLSCSLAIMFSIHLNANTNDKYIKITVSEGDSLWKISDQFSGQHSLSNEEFVSWVKLHNQLDEDKIYPGEQIVIPVNKKANTDTDAEFASAAAE